MKLVSVSREKADVLSRRKWGNIIDEFETSDMGAAEVTDFECSLKSAYTSLRRAVDEEGRKVRVTQSKGRIYLVKDVL